MKYTFKQFQAEYPNDDACLDAIMRRKYSNIDNCPTCGIVGKLTRIQGRRAYACKEGCHIYPCVGTPFEHSSTPLTLWFHAMYLMTATRNGVSAKELERQLGVTYKTAWRIGHELRKLMGGKNNTNPPMSGHVEVDETYIGGKERNKHANKRIKGAQGKGSEKSKAIVFGTLERDGNFKGTVVQNTKRETLIPLIEKYVAPGSIVSTDEFGGYKVLSKIGYEHGAVLHKKEQYVNGIHHINGVEGFWKHLKSAVISTHVHVSRKHLQKYVNEFSFRYNMRKDPSRMFSQLIASL